MSFLSSPELIIHFVYRRANKIKYSIYIIKPQNNNFRK